uniref:Uncharacterized protein n=1 Tax=Laurencia verruciformis TaxID=3073068 RepID=A0AA51NFT3_9FLOR|nr:hypothetical protein RU989_pgp181 [Laurencia obtusa]WMP12187.1 hypothetical protein [Laurencia verruciformis]WMP12830.1 hypothetical protein [Laurencia obtusa]
MFKFWYISLLFYEMLIYNNFITIIISVLPCLIEFIVI